MWIGLWLASEVLTGSALASPGLSGIGHLGARSVEAGQQWVGVGAGGVYGLGGGGGAGALVEAGTALGRRGALHGMVGLDHRVLGQAFAVAARHNVLDTEGVRFAVTGTVVGFRYEEFDERVFFETRWSPGIALETGARNVHFDLALPIWGVMTVDQFVSAARSTVPMAATLGVSFDAGEKSRLRVGLPEIVSYHFQSNRVYFDAGAIPFVAGFVWAKVGFVL